jgi:hypothetical protein
VAKNLGTTRYVFAVNWIAYNDDAACLDREQIAGYISVKLVADTFEREVATVARDVFHERQRVANLESASE